MKREVLGLITRLIARPFELKRPPSKLVAIVVPLSNRPDLLPDEEVSLRHLCHFLGRYDKFLVVPSNSKMNINNFKSEDFPASFFGSVSAHNRLLGSPKFYNRFLDYKYIFFYHLDSLAFSDQLSEWCNAGWDYIGPPFIHCENTPWVKESGGGNGGFTLLRVESALKVIHNRYRQQPTSYWLDLFTRNGARLLPLIKCLERLQGHFPKSRVVNRLLAEWRDSENPVGNRNNDMFWSFSAHEFLPQFKVATFEESLRFAFEVVPRRCLELNGGEMPFGCHAWGRYDREFWVPYLLK